MTSHVFMPADARTADLGHGATALVVTSPPYPMIAMWDAIFAELDPEVATALDGGDAMRAFDRMHRVLDEVWIRCHESLTDGGIICVNIGDAVRTVGNQFRLFANTARVVGALQSVGFSLLPSIVWRKPANSPTKFMGSGMLPGGAYVTLEHESIVIARKGGLRRPSSPSDRLRRRRSAIFWEERNEWYSDLWSLQGVRQELAPREGRTDPGRDRSAAFPLELAYRLIAMHTWMGDTVLDPFGGTGTTAAAAMALARSSRTVERDESLVHDARAWLTSGELRAALNERNASRIRDHLVFAGNRTPKPGHTNSYYSVPVVTSQETDLQVPELTAVETRDEMIMASYRE